MKDILNDLYEAGVTDDTFALIYEANKENYVAVNTPNGLSRREKFERIVMQRFSVSLDVQLAGGHHWQGVLGGEQGGCSLELRNV